ncbi:MAG: hypothetical protein M1828_004146 [Chrysothrix sp. TS-e1954]|nr:MAG: hypothetical protein M1828_004146 [Chrysothrix sp. TS-e1954]
MGSAGNFHYTQALLGGAASPGEYDGNEFQHHVASPSIKGKTLGRTVRRPSARHSPSEVSMRNHVAEDPSVRSLSRNATLPNDSPSFNIGSLKLNNETPNNAVNRKRPADHDAKFAAISQGLDPVSKLTRTDSGAFDSSLQPKRSSRLSPEAQVPPRFASPSAIIGRPREVPEPPLGERAQRQHALVKSPLAPQAPPRGNQDMRAASQNVLSREANHSSNQRPQAPSHFVGVTSNETVQHNRQRQLLTSGNESGLRELDDDHEEPPANLCLIAEPDSRPIPQELLKKEVDGIQKVVEQVEPKCSAKVREEVEKIRQRKQMEHPQPELDPEYWQSMVGIHRVLLHEFHDFFLASQHPTALHEIREKALRESMPARMWKFGIHDFLELLRSLLPSSLEYMLSFLYMAYQMVALLYETVPNFEETWMECLGDLARYRMAIEERDRDARENWTEMARFWYTKVMDLNPKVGRLHHHIAILSRHHALQQLSSYCRSLTAIQPFSKTKESIMHLFKPILARDPAQPCKSIDEQFIKLHGHLFVGKAAPHEVDKTMNDLLTALKLKPSTSAIRKLWRDSGAFMAISNIASMLGYESTMTAQGPADPADPIATEGPTASDPLSGAMKSHMIKAKARKLAYSMLKTALRLAKDDYVIPHVHLLLVFQWRVVCTQANEASPKRPSPSLLVREFPVEDLCSFLNYHLGRTPLSNELRNETPVSSFDFPSKRTASNEIQILEEDYLLRGQVWSIDYLPDDWFPDLSGRPTDQLAGPDFKPRSQKDLTFFDDLGHVKDTPRTPQIRIARVLHLAKRIAAYQPFGLLEAEAVENTPQWLVFNEQRNQFELTRPRVIPSAVKQEVNVKIEDEDVHMPMAGVRGEHELLRHAEQHDKTGAKNKLRRHDPDVKMEET